MFVKSEDTYKRIPQDQISELEKDVKSTAANQTRWHCRACWLLVVSTLSICLLGFMILYDYLQRRSSTEYCLARTTLPSPVTKDVRITYQTTTFDGSFFEENKFRKDGSPEVDEAWASLGVNYNPIIVPERDALKAGLRPDHIRVAEKYGGGYIGYIDGMHHLHCLDLVRQALWYNYDYYKAKGEESWINNSTILKKHVSHCLDIVRQQLMCSVELTFIGEVWWDDSEPHGSNPRAFVDFNTEHLCRNYDDIRAWAEPRQMPDLNTLPKDYLVQPQPGDRILHGIP